VELITGKFTRGRISRLRLQQAKERAKRIALKEEQISRDYYIEMKRREKMDVDGMGYLIRTPINLPFIYLKNLLFGLKEIPLPAITRGQQIREVLAQINFIVAGD